MASLHLITNVPEALITTEKVKALSQVLAETSNKPESICQVSVEAGVPMEFGGSSDSTVYGKYITLEDTRMAGEVVAIGGNKNARISARLADACKELFHIPKSGIYFEFEPTEWTNLGLRGTTCVELFFVQLGGVDAVEAAMSREQLAKASPTAA